MKKILIVVLTTVVVVGVTWASYRISWSRFAVRQHQCHEWMTQIGLAIRMYSMDHEGMFPPDLRSLEKYVSGHANLFTCACGRTRAGAFENVDEWTDYVYLPGATKTSHTNTIVLLCPGVNHERGGENALFVDGRVKTLKSLRLGNPNRNSGEQPNQKRLR